MTSTRRYVSPKREAQAAATRTAILEAFARQLLEPGREALSPSEAAATAGCSVRTVHGHFPTKQSRVAALSQWLDAQLFAEPVLGPTTVEGLPDHYRRIHRTALSHPLAAALLRQQGSEWREVRAHRRAARVDAVRRVVASIDAPETAIEESTAVLLALAGGEVSIMMREQSGLDDERIIDAIAHTVELIIEDLTR